MVITQLKFLHTKCFGIIDGKLKLKHGISRKIA